MTRTREDKINKLAPITNKMQYNDLWLQVFASDENFIFFFLFVQPKLGPEKKSNKSIFCVQMTLRRQFMICFRIILEIRFR
jgi:hypothetical protein